MANKKPARKTTEAQARAHKKYEEAHARRFSIKLVDSTDSDIITKLESVPSIQGYIKEAIRAYMASEKKTVTN